MVAFANGSPAIEVNTSAVCGLAYSKFGNRRSFCIYPRSGRLLGTRVWSVRQTKDNRDRNGSMVFCYSAVSKDPLCFALARHRFGFFAGIFCSGIGCFLL